MTIAMRHTPGLPIQVLPVAGRIARTEIFGTVAAAEPHWRALERGNAVATPYQRFDFLALWQRHVGTQSGVKPLIVVSFDAAGAPVLLLPFGVRRIGALRAVEFLGGKHTNYNAPVCARGLAAGFTRTELDDVLSRLALHADVLLLTNQPVSWQGAGNPLGLLPHQLSPSLNHSGELPQNFDVLFRERCNAATRKKIRKKAERLAKHGTVLFTRAKTPGEIRRVLDAFFAQKSARMRAQGIANAFDEPAARRMIEAGVTESAGNGAPVIELYSLSVDDVIIATLGGTVGSGRFSAMFNSISYDRFAVETPGEQLLIHVVRACCERGLTSFDLGVGEARYKNLLCGDANSLFDSFIGLTPAGRILAFAAHWGAALKRLIKQSPVLWPLAKATRRLRGRFGSE